MSATIFGLIIPGSRDKTVINTSPPLTKRDKSTPQLRLACLGPPLVWLNEHPLTFPTRKALALLIYLAVEGGLQPRPKLMALFWPNSDSARARSALRSTLAYLRRPLDALIPGSSNHFLHLDGDAVGFNFEIAFELDISVVATAKDLSGFENLTGLEQAIDLYRGDFLEGFSLPDAPDFDDWVSLQRERWHQAMRPVFDHLSRAHLDARRFEAAVTIATRWVNHDSLDEAAHRRLMEAHALLGNRAAALQAYEACQTVLKTELGIKPSPETEKLRFTIYDLRLKPVTHHVSRLTHHSSELPFVGRALEHSRLAELFRQAEAGRTQVIVIEGEAGIGKTRLAEEFLNGLTLQAVDVLRGRAFESGGRLPYQPLIDALRQRLERENAPDDLLPDVWLAELSRLLPELRERYPDLPPPAADENLARARLPEAIARLVQALAERSPMALLIDDLQWADDASLDVLRYACRAWVAAGPPILVLLILRSEALATTPEIESWLTALGRDVVVTRLPLRPLSAEETENLVKQLQRSRKAEEQGSTSKITSAPLPFSLPAHFAEWLYKETAGQPFFISETIRALPEQDWGKSEPLPEGILPPGVRQVILARLKALSDNAAALLTAAAVIGRPCAFEILCQITGLSELAALPDLEQLLNHRLLLETNDSHHPYQFAHDKIRDVVYTEAGDARRRMYHRQALEALEQALTVAQPGRRPGAAELAHHALAARLPEPAFGYSLAAGDEAMALFAIRDAIAHYEQAWHQLTMANLESAIPNLQALIPNLYSQLARAYELTHDYPQAETICREMLSYAKKTEQPSMACAALNRLASIAIYSQQMEKAAGWLVQAQQAAETAKDKAGLAQTAWHLGQLTHHINDFNASKEHCERALALAQEINDPALIAGASNSLAHALFFLGQVEQAAIVMEEARAGFAALGDRALEADSLVGLAGAHILSGRVEASIAAARSALAIGQEIENNFGQAMSRAWLVFGLTDRGDYEEALGLARQNLEAARIQELAPKLVAGFTAGLAYWAIGDYTAARTVHLELLPHIEEAGVPGYLEQINSHLCMDTALAGDWETAHTYARQALALRDYRALPLFIAPHWPETEALLRGGDVELAREDVRRWGELVEDVPRFWVGYLRSLALLAKWEGHVEQAIAHMQEALALAKQIGLPGEQWQILAKLGELYRSDGEEVQARQALGKAAEIIQALAANIDGEGLRAGFWAAEPARRVLERAG